MRAGRGFGATARDGRPGSGQSAANGRDNRPGGGLGTPIEAPDPLDKYRGWLIGGFGIVLITGAIYTVNHSKGTAPVVASAGGLLDGLKEELLQLEMEHKQGQISDDEYVKTKAALDQTLTRAIKRKASS